MEDSSSQRIPWLVRWNWLALGMTAALLGIMLYVVMTNSPNGQSDKSCEWSWHIDGGSVTATDNTASVVCHGPRCTVTAVCR